MDAAKKAHMALGRGLLERIDEVGPLRNLEPRRHSVPNPSAIPNMPQGIHGDAGLRLDVGVDGLCGLESKTVEFVLPAHFAPLSAYLNLPGHRLVFLLNFTVKRIKDAILRRVFQPGQVAV